ncbi:MAG: hypothetical protein Q7S03_02415 [bacterium]|nr:hypothetical protein [bacterium]
MPTIDNLNTEIESIKERNKRVEQDKKWETSWTRRLAIAFITYFLALLFMYLTGNRQPFLSALIPSVAFLLSTASLEIVKNWWLEKQG